MPGKRKDKENDGQKAFKKDVSNEQETFLQSFEKPTQIYRYLRTRNMISPIFLHRTLSYMKGRMSRNHKKRSNFKIDDILRHKLAKLEQKAKLPEKFLIVMFDSFNDAKPLNYSLNYAKVETILFKISHKKRKECSSDIEAEYIGTSYVEINPVEHLKKYSVINIPSESFNTVKTTNNCSYIILFRVHIFYNREDESSAAVPQFDAAAPSEATAPGLRKLKLDTKIYGSELMAFDKTGKCLLSNGEYVLTLEEIQTYVKTSIKNNLRWETLSEYQLDDVQQTGQFNPFENFDKMPSLKFRMVWSNEQMPNIINSILSLSKNESNNSNMLGLQTMTTTSAGGSGGHGANTATSSSNCNLYDGRKDKIDIIFQFISSNNSRQQTEASQDFCCPWCSIDCFDLYPLLKHLKLCHDRFKFIYVPQRNTACINVTINEMYDGSYAGSPHDYVGQAGFSFNRTGPIRRAIVTHLVVFRPPRRTKLSLAEFYEIDDAELNNQRPFLIGHNRLYHHTMTYMPVHPRELDIDSEAEMDPMWLQHKTIMMIDEFTDVNDGEKELMKMWNLHVMKYVFVGDCQISIACDMFIERKGREILEKKLYRNFLCHMCSLFDYGLLSPDNFYLIVQKLQNILGEYPEAKRIMMESRKEQTKYWETVGIYKPPMVFDPKFGYSKRIRIST